jgi:hypothetical protein
MRQKFVYTEPWNDYGNCDDDDDNNNNNNNALQ